jgi:8-oxo-dGTP diphosphatase
MVIEGGPARLATTASMHVLDEEFEHEPDIAWSDSAGAFVCNETIYRTLEAIGSVAAKTSDGRDLPAIFIHLPPESEVSLERQVDVVRRVVLALASKPRLEVVGALIFDAEGRILACRRPPEDVWGGWWEFPGGKVDAGEGPRDALVREISEELQLDVAPDRIVASLSHEYDDRHVSLDIWNCGVIDPKLVTPIEHDEVRWLDRGSLDSVKWLPADEPLIREWIESGLPQS